MNQRDIDERLLRELATVEALRYHIENFTEIPNIVQQYEDDEDGETFINELCNVNPLFEMCNADEVVCSIESVIDMFMEFYKYADRMKHEPRCD